MQRRTEPTRPTALRVRIRVGALLDGGWSTWFEGLAISPLASGETSLHGVVADQASLHGLLSRIRDLGIPLVGLEVTDADGPAARKAQAGQPEAAEDVDEPRSSTRPT